MEIITLNFVKSFMSVVQTQKCFKHTHHWVTPIHRSTMTLTGPETIIKMSSVMPFTFNAVELCVVTINERPWVCAREVCRALKYNKKTENIVKNHCSKENYAQKHQMSDVPATVTPVYWPKNSQKFGIYINEEGMYELLFSSQQPKAKNFRKHCCNVMFSQIQQQLSDTLHAIKIVTEILQTMSKPLGLQMKKNVRPINRKF